MKHLIFTSMTLLVACTTAASGSDLLLDRMAGDWTGTGERTQLQSGHKTEILTQVHAVIGADGRLVSHNQLTETPESGEARHYVRDYWVRPVAGSAGLYELGQGNQVGSQGRWTGDAFEAEQVLGTGETAYRIRSRTRFEAQESEYEETVFLGDRELARTEIHYRKD